MTETNNPRNALATSAALLGAYTGLIGMEHGLFELLQGPVTPDGVMIQAIGAPCDPATAWHACFPAMTLLPSMTLSGIAALTLGLALALCALLFAGRKFGAPLIFATSLGLLLVGGGFVPVLLGVIAGVAAARVHAGRRFWASRPGRLRDLLAALWPYSLGWLLLWFPLSWLLGLLVPQLVLALSGFLFIFFDIVLPVFVVVCAGARDGKLS